MRINSLKLKNTEADFLKNAAPEPITEPTPGQEPIPGREPIPGEEPAEPIPGKEPLLPIIFRVTSCLKAVKNKALR